MVPAFQGAFALKQVNPSKRLDHLQWAREHFLNYLTQCQYYHVAEFELPKTKTNSAENNTANSSMAYPSIVAMASHRQAKIERWVIWGLPNCSAIGEGCMFFSGGWETMVYVLFGFLLSIGPGESKLAVFQEASVLVEMIIPVRLLAPYGCQQQQCSFSSVSQSLPHHSIAIFTRYSGVLHGLYSPWGHRVGHNWATFTSLHFTVG